MQINIAKYMYYMLYLRYMHGGRKCIKQWLRTIKPESC
jgi:hypothetical protein